MGRADIDQRAILKPFIRDGLVDYEALTNRLALDALVDEIANKDLTDASCDEQLAFYLNAYNLVTLNLVKQRLAHDRDWPGPVSLLEKARFFMLARHQVAGQTMSLYTLENTIIRRHFGDPRIHFALNCASTSCPHLPGSLFVADSLDADLENFTRQFIESEAVRYEGTTHTLWVSSIFKWYRRDFAPSVLAFIARYREVPDRVRIRYQDYDWRLNSQ